MVKIWKIKLDGFEEEQKLFELLYKNKNKVGELLVPCKIFKHKLGHGNTLYLHVPVEEYYIIIGDLPEEIRNLIRNMEVIE